MSSSSSDSGSSERAEVAEPEVPKEAAEEVAAPEPVKEAPQPAVTVVGDLTPPLVSDLTQSGIEKEFLVKTLAKAHNFEEIVCDFPMRINLTVDFGKKEELMGVFCGLIVNHKQFSNMDDAKILKLVQFITGYGLVIDSEVVVSQMFEALVVLLEGISDKTVVETGGFKGKYAMLGYAAYGVHHYLAIEKITTAMKDTSYPLLQALIMMFRSKKFEELPNESQELIVPAFEGFIENLLRGNRQYKWFAIKLLDANFNFKIGNEEPSTKIPFDTVVGLLGGDYDDVRLAVVELLTKLPAEHPEIGYDSRLPAVLTHICRKLNTPTGAFAEAVYKFVGPRDELTGFYDLIAAQFLDDVTTPGALILCVELDFFNKRPELTTSAYPTSVSQPRLLRVMEDVKYIVSKFPFSDALAESVMTQLVKIYASEDLLKKAEIKAAALESIELFLKGCANCLRVVNHIFVVAILNINDVDILLAFATALGKLEIKGPERPLDEAFCKMFCYVYDKLRCYTDMLNIISLFNEIPDRSEPSNVVELVEKAVPQECRMRLLRTAETWLKARPRLLAVCVALPELTNKKLWELTKTLLSPEVLTFDLAKEYFITRAIRYFPFFLTVLEQEKLGEQITNNILVPKRKRVAATEAVRAVMVALPTIVKDKELTTEEQESLWKGLCRLMPVVNYNDFKKEVLNLHEVFPHIKDVTPTEDQYRKFLYPELARDFPVFLANVPPSDDLAKECIKHWFTATNANRSLARETKPIAELAFRLSQAPEVLFAAIFHLKKERLPISEEAIPFAYYVWAMTEAARARGVEIDEVMYTDFFLHFSRFNICPYPELRTASVAALAALFNLEDAPRESGPELSPTEIVDVALSLYRSLAKRTCDRFITVLVKEIINRDKFLVHQGYVLRAIFETRENFVNDDNVPFILDLFGRYTRFSPIVKHHFEKGVVALCERSMKEMVPVIMISDSAFKRLLLERILRSRTLRPMFITEYHSYLISIPKATKSLNAFTCINKIIFYEETNELDDSAYGRVLSEVFMWLGLAYDLEPSLNLIEFTIQDDNISETIDTILTKTTLSKRVDIQVQAATAKRLSKTAQRICGLTSAFSIAKTLAAYENCMLMLESPHEGYVLAAAVFFIRMLQAFVNYESDEAKDLKAKLKDGVLKALEIGSQENKLQITGCAYGVLPEEVLNAFTAEEITALYKAAVIGIRDGRENWCKQNAMLLLAQIIDKVPKDAIVADDLYAALKAGYDQCTFHPDFLKPLDVYLDFDHELTKFAVDTTKLSINGLARVLNVAESEIIRLLEKIAGSEDVIAALQTVYSPSQIANFGTTIVQNSAKPYSDKTLAIICKVAQTVHDVNEKPVATFKRAAIKPLLCVGEDLKHGMRDTVISAVEVIVK